MIRNRNSEILRDVRFDTLKPHPQNPKIHPDSQARLMSATLDDLGFAGTVEAYRNDGGELVLLDGHLRQKVAPDHIVDVVVLDFDEAEAAQYLMTRDPIGWRAERDRDAMDALMRDINTANAELQEFIAQEATAAGLYMEQTFGDGGVRHLGSDLGGLYNAENDHEIEPYKLAHRIEAIWQAGGGLCIDLFSGYGQLAEWYRRRFETVITVDKRAEEADFNMAALDFIRNHLLDYDFDFIDFDDEGAPAAEIAAMFEVLEGKRSRPFYMALTDGNGLNLQLRGRFDFGRYLMPAGVRQSTGNDYDSFEVYVTNFVHRIAERHGFAASALSSHQGRKGHVVYQTWLIKPQ